jgi:hypothetical protein
LKIREVDLKNREVHLRSVLARIGSSLCVCLAALLLFILVPILPVSISILAAVALGFLSYRAPVLAIMLMFFGTMLGYIYQFGLPVSVIVGLSVFFFIVSLRTTEPGSILGVAGGSIAAMLMTTSYYYLAIPIMVAVPLFRGRGRYIGSAEAILVFLVLCLPLLINFDLNHGNQPFPLLFGSALFNQKVPLAFVDIDFIFSKIGDAIISSTPAIRSYMNILNSYFPSFQTGAPFGRLLIVLLGGFLTAGTLAAFGISFLFRWLESREIGNKLINWISPPLAILGAEIIFLIPFSIMAAPSEYQNILLSDIILAFLASALLLGGAIALIEYWLRRRDLMVSLREIYLDLLPLMQEKVETLTEQVRKTRAVCSTIDLIAEDFAIRKAQQDLALATAESGHMSIEVLREKVDLFQGDQKQLAQAANEIILKIRRYYDDSSAKYTEYLSAFSVSGYSIGATLDALSGMSLNSLEHAKLVEEQEKVNALYQGASEKVVEIAEQMQQIIHVEFDPTLKSSGIEIGRNYFSQKNYSETLETLLAEFTSMDRIVAGSTGELEKKYTTSLNELRRILRESVIPAIDHLGDSAGVAHYSSLVSAADNLAVSPANKVRLIDLPQWLDKTMWLANMVTTITKELSVRLIGLEQTIEAKSPLGYNWGKNSFVQGECDSLLSGSNPALASDRLTRIEKALKIMEASAPLITQYARIREFMINYINIEFLMDQQLELQDAISDTDLPVKLNYAQQYLRLYAENHHGQVFIETGTGRLLKAGLSPNGRTT